MKPIVNIVMSDKPGAPLSEWRSIDTLPIPSYEGRQSRILMALPSGHITIGRFFYSASGEKRCRDDGFGLVHPTHWMPLPLPPGRPDFAG